MLIFSNNKIGITHVDTYVLPFPPLNFKIRKIRLINRTYIRMSLIDTGLIEIAINSFFNKNRFFYQTVNTYVRISRRN